jgi:amidase
VPAEPIDRVGIAGMANRLPGPPMSLKSPTTQVHTRQNSLPSQLSARALVDGLADGRWTSQQLTERLLERITTHSTLNAVCTVEAARAREQAYAADNRRVAGKSLGPLDGLPITLKDAMRVAGSRSTYGLWPYRNHIPRSSSAAAAALEAKGVVVLGRTTVPTGSFDWNGKNQVFPECTHPQDPALSPGGSSAGAAAAVAAGLSPLDIGSDLGGSIRVPCHFCGVAGLRTTDGWIPVSDMAPEGLPLGYEHLVTLGPIARDVADLSLVLDCWA